MKIKLFISYVLLCNLFVLACSPKSTAQKERICECFGGTYCKNGIIYESGTHEIPCSQLLSQCDAGRQIYKCKEGCRKNTSGISFSRSIIDMCEESSPTKIGSHCKNDKDCSSPRASIQHNTQRAVNTYLKCDISISQCVQDSPPKIDDFLNDCKIDLSNYKGKICTTSKKCSIKTPNCSKGVCLIELNEVCGYQSCSVECKKDDDCPQGFICEETIDIQNDKIKSMACTLHKREIGENGIVCKSYE